MGEMEENGGKGGGNGEKWGGNGGEMEKNWRKMGGKWRRIGGKWREMGKNGGKWRKMGGKGGEMGNREQIKREDVGTTSRAGEKWGEIGGKSEKMGGIERKLGWSTQFSQSRFPHFPKGSKTFPTVPFTNIRPPHSPTEKWEWLPLPDTHHHGGWCGYMQKEPANDCACLHPAFHVEYGVCVPGAMLPMTQRHNPLASTLSKGHSLPFPKKRVQSPPV